MTGLSETGHGTASPRDRARGWRRFARWTLWLLLLACSGQAFAQNCGAEGQNACPVWVRVPSCNALLVESGGRCVHPPCGREGEAACTVFQRVPSCDTGLVENNGRCGLPTPCGAQGQRACRIWERVPSCDPYLVESGGSCVHPACGREGEAACTINVRVPSCDINLAEVGGRCVLPTPCGNEGQRACRVWENIPSCRSRDLVESGGSCVHPACGRTGEAACTINVRVPSCDAGLIEVNGRCGPPTPCGGEGERACLVWERLPPSCNAGLVETGGRCVHPPCGREGERACLLTERVPSCDGALVETGGRCVRPSPGCGGPDQPACTLTQRLTPCDAGLAQVSGLCIAKTPCGGRGQRACALDERREQAGTLRGRACAVRLREIPGCTGECFGSSGTCGDPLARMTEPSIDVRLLPRTAPMRGYADVHVHMFSHLAFGGGVLAGRPYDPQAGAAGALKPDYATDLDLVSFAGTDLPTVNCPPTIPGCGRVVLHGDHLPVIDDSAGLGTGDGTRSNFGAPLFNGWPTWHTTSHQQVYYRWLERAWRGGLRLMVMLAVNNEVLCKTSKRVRGTDCEQSMPAIDAQLQAAKEFERWINAQRGGGWFVIVRTPDEAERAIRAGKLAVVLGIETDSLFDCKAHRPCSPQYIAEQVAKYRDLGVRHIYPVHNFDNGLVGTAVWMNILNAGNRVIERQWYDVGACSTSDFRLSTDVASFAVGPIFNLIEDNNNVPYPAYPPRPGCNVRGLAPGGVDLVGQLMNAGMMIDIDHMSHRSVDDTIALARARGGYPLVAGHGLFSDVYEAAGKRHERMRTREQLDALRDLGGLVSVMTVDEMERGGEVARPGGGTYVNDCLHSSKSFAQNYLYAIGVMRGPVALGSDFNGFAPHVGPRFGDDGCGGDAAQWAAQRRAGGRLVYPFTLTGFGVFDRQRSGQRTFDFNIDGLAHIGLLPDLIADMQATGVSEEELDPLFRSAQAYVEAWRKAEGLRTPPSP